MLPKRLSKIIAQLRQGTLESARKLALAIDKMAKKKTPKPFRAVTAVKSLAREVVGAPPATRRDPDKKKVPVKGQKHKPTLGQLLTGE